MVGVYFYVLEGDGLLEEDEEDALDEGTELGVLLVLGMN